MKRDRMVVDDELTRQRAVNFSRRRTHRSRPGLMMARLASDTADDLCLVTDLSPRGAGLRTIRPRSEGERVLLDFGDALVVGGTMRWNENGRCGVEFDEVVDLGPLFEAGLFRSGSLAHGEARAPTRLRGPRQRRAQPRLRRCARVVLQHGGRNLVGQLIDVSPAGGRIDLVDTAGFGVGDRVSFWVEDRFDCEGEVRWIAPQALGVAFDPPLRVWKLEKWLVDGMEKCGECRVESCAAPSFNRALRRRKAAGEEP